MKTKDKPYVVYQVRDAETREVVRLPDDRPLRVSGYTIKSARHRAKRIVRDDFTLEPVN